MDLKSGYPWWAVRNGLMHAFPPLERDLRCDVAVVGGGITGALIADEFARHGHDVAVVDQRDIGWGSSAVSTALLQYEIDTHMADLARRYDPGTALLAYRSCEDAIEALAEVAARVRGTGFRRCESVYYASSRRHRRALREEYELRAANGFEVSWLDADQIRERYGFEAPCALRSRRAARIDPYRLTLRLFHRLQSTGVQVHDRSEVQEIEPTSNGVTLRTRQGVALRARHVVLAMGYAGQRWLRKRVARNRSSYAYVTDPLDRDALGILRRSLLWETARPYLYLRTTDDDRLLVGGEDDAIDVAARRDRRVDAKAKRLRKQVAALFPDLPLAPAFAWAGTFAETADGLPFFGPHAQYGPRVHFAMAYGGNGITYSMLGAGLLRARVERRRHPLSALFSFERLR